MISKESIFVTNTYDGILSSKDSKSLSVKFDTIPHPFYLVIFIYIIS